MVVRVSDGVNTSYSTDWSNWQTMEPVQHLDLSLDRCEMRASPLRRGAGAEPPATRSKTLFSTLQGRSARRLALTLWCLQCCPWSAASCLTYGLSLSGPFIIQVPPFKVVQMKMRLSDDVFFGNVTVAAIPQVLSEH